MKRTFVNRDVLDMADDLRRQLRRLHARPYGEEINARHVERAIAHLMAAFAELMECTPRLKRVHWSPPATAKRRK